MDHLLYNMDVPKKYVMANIKIPIEVKENNKCEPYMDLLYMEITPLDSLPEPITDTVLKDKLKQNLYIFLSKMFPEHKEEQDTLNQSNIDIEVQYEKEKEKEKESIKEIQLFVEKEYLKKLKKPMNTTFKKYNKKSCKKYTLKTYDNNGR